MANGDDTSVAQPPAPDDVTPDIQQGEAAAAQALQPAQTAGPNIAPAAAANVMGGTPTLPTVQQPPITIDHRLDDQHMSGLRGILDRVANIMGGGETYHVTKDPDGNVSIDKTPATTGEKWGRIAAAALSGAATGLAQQGVNAPAKSVAAGFQMGQQVAQAGRTQAEQEAQAQQQLMTRNAQNAYLHQQIIGARFQNQNAPRELARKEAQQDVEFQNFIMDNDGTDWGRVKNMDEVANITNAHPELIDHHVGQGGSHLITVPEGDGVHVYSIPNSQTNVRLTEDKRLPDTYVMNDDGMGFTKVPGQLVRRGTKIGDFTTGAQGSYAQQEKVITAVAGNKAKAEAAKQPRVLGLLPTPGGEGMAAVTMPREGGTPTSAVIPGVVPRGAAGEGGGGTAPDWSASTPQETQQFLQTLPAGDASIVRAIVEGRQQPPTTRSKQGLRLMQLVNQADPTFNSQMYPTYQKMRQDFASGQVGTGLNFMNTALNHLDTMQSLVPALNNVSVPLVGNWINSLKNSALQQTNPAISQFLTAQKAVRDEVARAYRGNGITEGEERRMGELLNAADSPTALNASLDEFRTLLQGKLNSYQQQWQSTMPMSQRNAMLDQITARGTAFRQPAAPAPAAPAPQPAPNQPQAPPAVGAVVNGYRYMGGPPGNPSSWQAVGGTP